MVIMSDFNLDPLIYHPTFNSDILECIYFNIEHSSFPLLTTFPVLNYQTRRHNTITEKLKECVFSATRPSGQGSR